MFWYKRDPNAALTGMAELNLEQRGLYNSLLDLLYAQDGAVADDDPRVARQLGVHHHQYRRIKAELIAAGKLSIVDGHLQCPRVEATLKDAHRFARAQVRRRNGKSTPPVTPPVTPLVTPQVTSDIHQQFQWSASTTHTQTQQERYYRETFKAGAGSNGSASHSSKPKHGQRSPRGRIWFDVGTLEFEAHSDDYRNAHHGLDPPMQWDKTGAWFEIIGEAA